MLIRNILSFFLFIMIACSCESESQDTHENYIVDLEIETIQNAAVIDNEINLIRVVSPFGLDKQYVANFTVSDGATAHPESGSYFYRGDNLISVTSATDVTREYNLSLEFRDRTALLIIDLQNANFPVYNEDELLSKINYLHDKAHNSDAITIFVQHTMEGEWKEGSKTWEIHPSVVPYDKDTVIQKISISAMTDQMKNILEENLIDKIVLTGTLTELCISYSVLPAFKSGYCLYVPRDCHSTNDPDAEMVIEQFYDQYKSLIIDCNASEIEF